MSNKIYIGWDSREGIAYNVLKNSITRHTHSHPEIIPLIHKELRKQNWFRRPWNIDATSGNWIDAIDGKKFATEFSHSRFLVPALCKHNGWALFMDADMIFTDDVKKLFSLCDDKYAVMCRKHHHNPKNILKMDGVPQEQYYRKNWSSFMLFNCGHPANRKLTPELVNSALGSYLHQFQWIKDDKLIGELPNEYNWIEGYSDARCKPSVIHYTEGGPWFKGYEDVAYADKWLEEYNHFMDGGEYEPVKDIINVSYGVHNP